MLSANFRGHANKIIVPVARLVSKSGINPGTITLSGLFFSIVAGVMFAQKNLLFALAFLTLSSILDAIDGAVARELDRTSEFGGFLDSLTDRYSDSFVLIGVAFYLGDHYLLVFIVLVGSLLVSYSRARAENYIEKCDVGIAERAERLIILAVATVLEITGVNGSIYAAMIILAVITHFTVLQRVNFTYRSLR